MKSEINLGTWPRRDHFEFFNTFEDPFFGITANLDCTQLYALSKRESYSFFLLYLHKTLCAANQIPEFKMRIEAGKAYLYDHVHASPTLIREDGTFAFGQMDFNPEFDHFANAAAAEIERIKFSTGLFTRDFPNNIIHFSSIPWINFTSLSHARKFYTEDSCPKISFGKMTSNGVSFSIPISVHVHHGLADALHVSQFLDTLQSLFDEA